ncbi:MAG: histidinol dehydrogenase, partial [Pseudomonadota bacterium]
MRRLDASAPGFAAAFDVLVNDRRESASDVSADVAAIIARVKAEGDAALTDYTAKFDRFDLDARGWSISKEDCAAAYAALAPDLRDALNLAADRIRAYHAAQLPEDRDYRDATGARLGARWNAVDAAGVYVPGGRAAYPSSV